MKIFAALALGWIIGFCTNCWMLYSDKLFSRKAERELESLGDQARKQ